VGAKASTRVNFCHYYHGYMPMRIALVVVSVVIGGTFFVQPTELFADAPPISDCVNALEQLSALQTVAPVYKPLGGDRRQYLDDGDRPAEIARIQKIIAGTCSKDSKTRATEQAAADRLHTARSEGCAETRERLRLAEKPGSRDPEDYVEDLRAQVAKDCPTVPMSDVWLVQMVPQPQ
jgi:hypothetical protein